MACSKISISEQVSLLILSDNLFLLTGGELIRHGLTRLFSNRDQGVTWKAFCCV